MRQELWISVVAIALLAGCSRQVPPASSTSRPAALPGLTEEQVRKFAMDLRDAWLKENTGEVEQIGQAVIKRVEKTDTGWYILFEQVRFPGQPEGESHHFLHIYLDSRGRMEKVVRGPDVIA